MQQGNTPATVCIMRLLFAPYWMSESAIAEPRNAHPCSCRSIHWAARDTRFFWLRPSIWSLDPASCLAREVRRSRNCFAAAWMLLSWALRQTPVPATTYSRRAPWTLPVLGQPLPLLLGSFRTSVLHRVSRDTYDSRSCGHEIGRQAWYVIAPAHLGLLVPPSTARTLAHAPGRFTG